MASLPVRTRADLLRIDGIEAEIVELRLDYLSSLTDIDLVTLEGKQERLILTVRDVDEGGANRISPEGKKNFLEKAIERGFSIDVEANFADKYSFDCTGQIVSRHFLAEDPEYSILKEFVEKYRGVSRITKIALRTSNNSRNLLARLLRDHDNLAVMEVDGETSSRLLYSLLGSRLLYCHTGEKTSPGQISCHEAREFFKIIEKE